MALLPITVAQLRGYLRVETTVEDWLIAELLAESIALLETKLGRPIVGEGRTFGASGGYHVHLSARVGGSGSAVHASGGETLAALSEHPDYSTRLVPLINAFVRTVAVDAWQHRNPASTSESTAGVSVSYPADYEIPARALGILTDLERNLAA